MAQGRVPSPIWGIGIWIIIIRNVNKFYYIYNDYSNSNYPYVQNAFLNNFKGKI